MFIFYLDLSDNFILDYSQNILFFKSGFAIWKSRDSEIAKPTSCIPNPVIAYLFASATGLIKFRSKDKYFVLVNLIVLWNI